MTEQNIARLKDLFYRVKQFYFGTSKKAIMNAGTDTGEASDYVAACKRALAEEFGQTDAARPIADDAEAMLSAACRYVLDALVDRNYRLAGDIAAVAVRLCGVYTFPFLSRKKFFETVLCPLRDKHEENFFAELETDFLSRPNAKLALSPCFSAKEKGARYYEEDTDKEMQEAHPVLYAAFAVCGMLLLLAAVVGFGLVAHLALSLSGAWIFLGYLGAFLFGIGLFSFLMAWIHQYMGHVATFVLWGVGALFMVLSLLLL